MSWIGKLFGKKDGESTGAAQGDENDGVPGINILAGLDGIRFGRYSDNNKTYTKALNWYKAEDLFKAKKFDEAFLVFFEYLRDDAVDNVHFRQEGDTFTFDILQGSKKVHGKSDGDNIVASVPLAIMPEPSTAVMRRLLDMNFGMYYSRAAMNDDGTLCMLFDTEKHTSTPNKLYVALRELATKADRQDDLLLADFPALKPAGTEHIQPLSERELEIKYRYFRTWITDGLKMAEEQNQDSFAGAIAYLLLDIVYKIDFLIVPEAKLLGQLEDISKLYWDKKDTLPLIERNKLMRDSILKLQDVTKEQFAASVYKSVSTFAISMPPKAEKVKDNIFNPNKDSKWYAENKYPAIAVTVNEYGVLYNEFIYSMPRILTALTTIYMMVMQADYFAELGMEHTLYNKDTKEFDKEKIKQSVDAAMAPYKDKYASMKWDHSKIKYDSLYDFGISFSEQMANMNLETKR